VSTVINTTDAPLSDVQTGPLRAVRAMLKGRSARIGLTILLAFLLIAIFAPWLAPHDVHNASCGVFEAPSSRHPLGCDDGGVDMLSLVLVGSRVSLIVGFTATLVAMTLGGSIGLLSGYFGGGTDVALMRVTDYFLVIPDLVLMIVIAAVWGPSLSHVIVVIGILLWTGTARVVRAQVKSIRERTYVKRAQTVGATNSRIIFRHVLPQVGPLLIASTVLTIAVAIFDETALAFLGLSDPTAVTWGTIMEHAFDRTAISAGAWWAILPPGLAVALVIVGCYLVGQAIEDALNPRLRVAYLSPKSWRLRPLVGRGSDAL
jgi:peptide/nickel transport system permease protein